MINIYAYETLGYQNHGWLETRHHFSFDNYFNPERMGFSPLVVFNDDIIQANTGFPMHPHENMEIITYVREGAITYEDSQGNIGRTEAGHIQVMSTGSGVQHSEFNKEETPCKLFQIWIEPHTTNIPLSGKQEKWLSKKKTHSKS